MLCTAEMAKGEKPFVSQPLCKSVSRAGAKWMCMCCNVPRNFAWAVFRTVKGEGSWLAVQDGHLPGLIVWSVKEAAGIKLVTWWEICSSFRTSEG